MRSILIAAMLLFSSVASSAQSITITSAGWVQISPTVNFALQSFCDYNVRIKPSAADPGVGDRGLAGFRVEPRGIWVQMMPTADTWWARAESGSCTATVEGY